VGPHHPFTSRGLMQVLSSLRISGPLRSAAIWAIIAIGACGDLTNPPAPGPQFRAGRNAPCHGPLYRGTIVDHCSAQHLSASRSGPSRHRGLAGPPSSDRFRGCGRMLGRAVICHRGCDERLCPVDPAARSSMQIGMLLSAWASIVFFGRTIVPRPAALGCGTGQIPVIVTLLQCWRASIWAFFPTARSASPCRASPARRTGPHCLMCISAKRRVPMSPSPWPASSVNRR